MATATGARAGGLGSFPVARHFIITTERALLHAPDVELLEDSHSQPLPEGSVIFCLSFIQQGDMIYAEVKEPAGWILAQSGSKRYCALAEHVDDLDLDTSQIGGGGEESCSFNTTSENFCFVGSISSFFGLGGGQSEATQSQKAQKALVSQFRAAKKSR